MMMMTTMTPTNRPRMYSMESGSVNSGGSSQGDGSSPKQSIVNNSLRPNSAGRASKNLKRRFTTPPEVSMVNSGTGSVASLQYYTLYPDRENAESLTTDVFVTASETLDDIQTLVINQSDHLRSLRLRGCTQLTSENLHTILRCVTPKLLQFEIREAEGHNQFDLDHLQHLVSKCKHLRSVVFEDCFLIDHRCLEEIGKHLLELQNIAFIHTKRKPWPYNPIHEIVLHVPLELHSLKFVGFDEIADYHVNYAVDCYFGSLNAISLGDCPLITDRAIDYISTNCKLLRHIELFKTNITDSTLWILAKHCSNLFYIDLSHCPKVTDYGVKELVQHAIHLRYINLSWNLKIKDLAFQSIARHCTSIVRIKLDGTSVTHVPASIIKRKQTLREISLNNVSSLSMTPAGYTATALQSAPGLATWIAENEDRNLNYRLKVFLLGASGVGKSDLIRALIGKQEVLEETGQEGCQVHTWRPLKDSSWGKSKNYTDNIQIPAHQKHLTKLDINVYRRVLESLITRDVTEDERDLSIALWDCHSREVLKGVHPVYFTDVCCYIVMCNLEDSASVEKVPKFIHTIYSKALRPQVFVLATRADKYSEEECQAKLDLIKRSIDGAELVRRNSINVELALMEELGVGQSGRIQDLQRHTEDRYRIRKLLAISVTTGKGLDVLRKQFLNMCLDGSSFPHLKRPIPPGWVELHDEIIKLRERRIVCLTWHEFEELAIKEDRVSKPRLDECVGFLHQVGVILDFRSNSADLICIDPPVFAACACALHIDDQKKSFRFEAKRFWPREQVTRPPEANILAMALEDIPNRGLLKESLLPLIWQATLEEEEQVVRVRTCMLEAALLAVNKSSRIASDSLMLPGFPNLLPQSQYVIPLLGLLADAKPQLNWTSRPFHGDVQISLYHYFLPVMPPGLNHRLVALVNNALIDKSAYHYYWKFGTLTRISDILLFVSCEQDEFLEISARITAEDDNDAECVRALWLELVNVMNIVMEFMKTAFAGVRTTVSMICYGDLFYMDDKVDTEPELTLAKVFHYAKMQDDIQFKDSGENKFLDMNKLIPNSIAPTAKQELDSWTNSLLVLREKALETQRLRTPPEVSSQSQDGSSPAVSRPKKKKISINWSVLDATGVSVSDEPTEPQLNGVGTHVNGTGTKLPSLIDHSPPPSPSPPSPLPPVAVAVTPTTITTTTQVQPPEVVTPALTPRQSAKDTLVNEGTTRTTTAPPVKSPPLPPPMVTVEKPPVSPAQHSSLHSIKSLQPAPERTATPRASSSKPSLAVTPSNSRASSGGSAKNRSKACNLL